MTREQIQDFNVRISQANQGQLLVITYEICICYLQEVAEAFENGNLELVEKNYKRAQNALLELQTSLDYEYEISAELTQLYRYFQKVVADGIAKRNADNVDEMIQLLVSMKESFASAAQHDESGAVMHNTSQIYAGLTYGKGKLNESVIENSDNRGYRV